MRNVAPLVVLLASTLVVGCDMGMMGSNGGMGGAPTGGSVLSAYGGTGAGGIGGNGAAFVMYAGGAIDLRRASGTSAKPDLGSNPRTISADMTIGVGSDNTMTTVAAGSQLIMGDDGSSPATGLQVMSGATLLLNPWRDSDNADGDSDPSTGSMDQACMTFANGVFVEGSIVMGWRDAAESPGSGGSSHSSHCRIEADDIVVAPSGSIDAEGVDDSDGSEDGGAGGSLEFRCHGSMSMMGSLACRGGNGANGGHAGAVNLNCDANISFAGTGTVDISGGNGLTSGGAGGSASLDSSVGIASEVDWDAEGGDSDYGEGGQGGGVDMQTSGTLSCTGALMMNGGDSAAGPAGDAGHCYVQGQSCHVMNMMADGGHSHTGAGGDGGQMEVSSSGASSVAGGTMSAQHGTGSPDGMDGHMYVDGGHCMTGGMMSGGDMMGGY